MRSEAQGEASAAVEKKKPKLGLRPKKIKNKEQSSKVKLILR